MSLTPRQKVKKKVKKSNPKKVKKKAKKVPPGMVVYWDFEDSTIAFFSDHSLLREYSGYKTDPGFITEVTAAAMVKLLDEKQSEDDVKWREVVDMDVRSKVYRAAVFTDFTKCFGREAEKGDSVRACVRYKVGI